MTGFVSKNINFGNNNPSGFNLTAKDVGLVLLFPFVAGFVFTVIYFILIQKFAGTMIKVSLVLSVMIYLAAAIGFFIKQVWIAGGIMLLITLLIAFFFYRCRFRIPFAKVMLKTVTSITRKYPATFFVGFIGIIFQFALGCWVSYVSIGLGSAYDNQSWSSGTVYGLAVYTAFVFYWTAQVFSNVVHITVDGVFATFYFRGVSGPLGTVDVPVVNPTVSSAKRALTTSLGPNCYGSLLIAIIMTLRLLVDNARNNPDNDNVFCQILLCCIACILAIFRDLLEYFNKYAFAQVAIYGKDFCTAAKDTWGLVKTRGIDAIINDDLIGSVLFIGTLMCACLTGSFSLLAILASPSIAQTTENFVGCGLIGFFIGLIEFSIMANVIDSGVVTTFVCLAEDPQALFQTKPDLYHKIQEVYPQVILGF